MELQDKTFRVNATFDNPTNINILGFVKDMQTNEKTNVRATIWKNKKDGSMTKAYQDFQGMNVSKGDLLFTKIDNISEYNGDPQFTIKQISDIKKSKFNNEPKTIGEEFKAPTPPKQENTQTTIPQDIMDGVPWETDMESIDL